MLLLHASWNEAEPISRKELEVTLFLHIEVFLNRGFSLMEMNFEESCATLDTLLKQQDLGKD